MKKISLLLLGAMLAAVSSGMANDQWAEERLKAKTGRYSPAEEARRQALARSRKTAHAECERACCRGPEQANIAPRPAWADYLQAKLGRLAERPAGQTEGPQRASSGSLPYSAVWMEAKLGRRVTSSRSYLAELQAAARECAATGCGRSSCCS